MRARKYNSSEKNERNFMTSEKNLLRTKITQSQQLPVSQFEMRLAEELDERIEFDGWYGGSGGSCPCREQN
jgi:hypothetical protein